MNLRVEQSTRPVPVGSEEDEVTVLDRRDNFGFLHDREMTLNTRFAVGAADHAAREVDLLGGEEPAELATPFRTTFVDQPSHRTSDKSPVGKECVSTCKVRWAAY